MSTSTKPAPSKPNPAAEKTFTKKSAVVKPDRPNKVARSDVDITNRAAESFLQLYYERMDAPLRDSNLLKLYRENSLFTWNGEQTTGATKIKEYLSRMPESKHEIQSWDCHPVPGNTPSPILITVSGTVTHGARSEKSLPSKNLGVLPRIFSQTFVLAPDGKVTQQPEPGSSSQVAVENDLYYIRSDTLRFCG